MGRLSFVFIILTLIIFQNVHPSDAGSLIIRDSRINDPAITPALGRGYNLASNSFKPVCMINIISAEPLYDFRYDFESIETDLSINQGFNAGYDGSYSGIEINAMVRSASGISAGEGEYSHSVKVELNMDSYYASIDEIKSRLSLSSENLLKKRDIAGFFHACGSTYIRSLGRNAKFVSIFTYVSKSAQRDFVFEAQLQLQIKSFGAVLMGGGSIGNSAFVNFSTIAREKKLIITSSGWGLGKNGRASLISYDLETFKAAVKSAFLSMQSSMSGRVVAMEVIPWTDNAAFQEAMYTDEEKTAEQREDSLRKKYILNQNAEFLGEIEKAEKQRVDQYYTAKICKEIIKLNYKQDDKFIDGYESAKVINKKSGKSEITLGELDNLISIRYIDDLFKKHEDFMNGDQGAQKCIDMMFGEHGSEKIWNEYADCVKIKKELETLPADSIVDNCCSPVIIPFHLTK